jgi:tetratricopeptide (TPR) repeat protein
MLLYACGVAAKRAKKKGLSPEEHLRRAMGAPTRSERLRWAKLGLTASDEVDATTHAMLLRQLYLGLFEGRRFREAHVIALQASEVGVLPDVMLQDAARAALAAGDLEDGLAHLREAARSGPASRRAFHHWTLGSVLFLAHRYEEAIFALARAARTGAKEKPLYRAHLALARIAGGQGAPDLQRTIDALVAHPSGQGYGRFVLGHLAYAAGAWPQARAYLEAFLERVGRHQPAAAVALEGEARMARATLKKISARI